MMSPFPILIISLLALLTGCTGREGEPVLPSWVDSNSLVSASLNGSDWKAQYDQYGWLLTAGAYTLSASAESICPVFHGLLIQQITRSGSARSLMAFQLYSFEPGRYNLIPKRLGILPDCTPEASFSTSEGDAETAVFRLHEKADNYLFIDKYDKEKSTIEGRFQVTFVPVRVGRYSFLTDKDTLRFTEGRFRANITKGP